MKTLQPQTKCEDKTLQCTVPYPAHGHRKNRAWVHTKLQYYNFTARCLHHPHSLRETLKVQLIRQNGAQTSSFALCFFIQRTFWY